MACALRESSYNYCANPLKLSKESNDALMDALYGAWWRGTCSLDERGQARLREQAHMLALAIASDRGPHRRSFQDRLWLPRAGFAPSSSRCCSRPFILESSRALCSRPPHRPTCSPSAPLVPSSTLAQVRVHAMERLKVDAALTKLQLVPELATEDLVNAAMRRPRHIHTHTAPYGCLPLTIALLVHRHRRVAAPNAQRASRTSCTLHAPSPMRALSGAPPARRRGTLRCLCATAGASLPSRLSSTFARGRRPSAAPTRSGARSSSTCAAPPTAPWSRATTCASVAGRRSEPPSRRARHVARGAPAQHTRHTRAVLGAPRRTRCSHGARLHSSLYAAALPPWPSLCPALPCPAQLDAV